MKIPTLFASPKPSQSASAASGRKKIPQGEKLFRYILSGLDQSNGQEDILKELIAMGYLKQDAEESVEIVAEWRGKNPTVRLPVQASEDAKGHDGDFNLIVGALICLIGLGFTIFSFVGASSGRSNSYVIAWGAIVFGALQFFRGMGQNSEPKT